MKNERKCDGFEVSPQGHALRVPGCIQRGTHGPHQGRWMCVECYRAATIKKDACVYAKTG